MVGLRLAAVGVVEAAVRHGLARVQRSTLQLQRLTQDILKGQMTDQERDQALTDAETLLTSPPTLPPEEQPECVVIIGEDDG